ncbi:USP32 isoform 4, partial [Pan troglodytes]
MGAKESRIGFLSYEEALRRVTDVELKRLKDAFKRTCGLSYYMGQHCFIREVLGDGVPPKVAEVCHIVLGLRPATPEEEGQIIRGWLERESRYGLQAGHNWFIISMQWWQQWKEYVKYDANPVVIEPSSVLNGG